VKGGVTCVAGPGEREMKMTFAGSYGPDAYEIAIRQDREVLGGQPGTIETRVFARRTGDCPATEEG